MDFNQWEGIVWVQRENNRLKSSLRQPVGGGSPLDPDSIVGNLGSEALLELEAADIFSSSCDIVNDGRLKDCVFRGSPVNPLNTGSGNP